MFKVSIQWREFHKRHGEAEAPAQTFSWGDENSGKESPDSSSKAHVYYPPHFISRRRGDINRVQIRDYFTYSAKGTTGNQCVCL
ncbi:predicted protein [Botrytis cinerea T4]|uniref:Uncharacterized protein n=1 Tax=Botryotinia fuckeliana (strain T4) TaxID=999810 RepID=G2YE39_BOTF4|nr:predicted protein [Botrytis cinerea T4]